jgi:2''-5'' RNA ligase
MRCFIAVDISDDKIIERLNNVASMLNLRGVKPVERENLHITLKFLGEINESFVEELKIALKKVKFMKFNVHVYGLGAFPKINNPRVIWAGIKEGFQELITLYNLVNDSIKNEGLRFEKDKEFHPHVTLARVKFRENIKEVIKIINEYLNEDFGSFEVKSFCLKQSILTPKGPIYSNIEVYEI